MIKLNYFIYYKIIQLILIIAFIIKIYIFNTLITNFTIFEVFISMINYITKF